MTAKKSKKKAPAKKAPKKQAVTAPRIEAEDPRIEDATPGKVVITNCGQHNLFTEYECLKPGESGECSIEVARMLESKDLAVIYND